MMDEHSRRQTPVPPFLLIPVARLIVLSILSCGIYEAYWIYEHWAHIKRRERLRISPFWRGAFCAFYCYSLFKEIHSNVELREVRQPPFSPGKLFAGWILAIVIANLLDLAPGPMVTWVSFLAPTYLFFVPVQHYVNSATQEKYPGQPYRGWSLGHVLCLVLGLAVWGFTIFGPRLGSFGLEQ